MKYILIVVWESGEKEEHAYNTKEQAEKAGAGYKTAFGKQISWYGITERR